MSSDNNMKKDNSPKKKKGFPGQDPGKSGEDNKFTKNLLLWLFVGMGAFSMIFLFQDGRSMDPQITYSEYRNILSQGLITDAVIYKSQLNDFEFQGFLSESVTLEVDGKTKSISKFVTKLVVVDSATEAEWADKGISIRYEEGDDFFWGTVFSFLPLLLLFGLVIFFMKRMQNGGGGGQKGLFSFGKARIKLMNENENPVTFEDVAGIDEAKYELEEIIEFLKEPAKFQKLGGKIPKGVLLLGPPGTGKTLLARAVAGEAEVPFFSMSGADFVEMFVGVGASRVRDLFEQAKKNSPCICFIDEIDAVGRQRGAGVGGGHDEREQTLNQLLVEMDGFEQNSGVIIVAATNRPDVLDPALLRPGRFDRQVVVDRPDVRGRKGIFEVHVKKIPIGNDVDLETLAKGTPGLSGADIANIVNESALLAARRNSEKVTMYDFENAKDKILMGIERKSMVVSDKEKEMTAYHEMGHALVGKLSGSPDPVHKVTIIPRGQALGVTSYLPDEEFYSKSKTYLEQKLAMMMGGRAAELLIFNVLSTGAQNDIQRATEISKKMVCDWGMSDIIGPVNFTSKQDDVFLGREISQPKDHSEKTSEIIDLEVRKVLTNAYAVAEDLLRNNLELLHKCSKILVERETVTGDELDKMVQGEDLPEISNQAMEAIKSINLNPEEINEEIDEEIREEKENDN
jgi:cell division protease FtsH